MTIATTLDGDEVSPAAIRRWARERRAKALTQDPRPETPTQRRDRLAAERAERLRKQWVDDENGGPNVFCR